MLKCPIRCDNGFVFGTMPVYTVQHRCGDQKERRVARVDSRRNSSKEAMQVTF